MAEKKAAAPKKAAAKKPEGEAPKDFGQTGEVPQSPGKIGDDKSALALLDDILKKEEAENVKLQAKIEDAALTNARMPALKPGQLRVYDKFLNRYITDSETVIKAMMRYNPNRFTQA